MMSAMAYRTYLGLRSVNHVARSNIILSRGYYADHAVTVGTPQERNSESFQVKLSGGTSTPNRNKNQVKIVKNHLEKQQIP